MDCLIDAIAEWQTQQDRKTRGVVAVLLLLDSVINPIHNRKKFKSPRPNDFSQPARRTQARFPSIANPIARPRVIPATK